ncbi:MAG: cation:proton antiporter [Betaproteobacteria bacterium RIFCSPLOWO2_02_FULL_62_17]|nr:MAG: cation:proton antiporter [Betaproteobacteria bacterium RIFCSPLOWO2_02_FULL_62_17]
MSGGELIMAALAIPLMGAIGIALCHRRPDLRETATLATSALLFVCVASLLSGVMAGERPQVRLLEPLPGLPVAFLVEPLGMLFALVASALWMVNSIYSIGYMRANKEANQTRFYVCFALALAATIGIAFAANLITLFLFYEILTLVTFPLVAHHGTEEAKRGGRVYLALLLGTSVLFLLPAIVFTWHVAGTTDFRPGGILPAQLAPAALTVLLALYMFGIGKAALMPFHRWLPAAMVAPTPVSALLHAVAVVKAGVFSVLKVIIYVFGLDQLAGTTGWLIGISGFTILAASVVALNADNLKRRLAYSTISQLSYVVMAAALLTPLSVLGAALHLVVHAFGKITLFLAAGAIYTAAHKTEVSQLNGIGRRMPWTMTAFTLAALSLIGIPPAAGFISKWFIVSSALESGQFFVLAVMIASTLLNAAYFLPIVHAAFFRKPDDGDESHVHGEAPWPMVLALMLSAGATIVLFFLSDPLLRLARQLVPIGS